MSNIYVYKSKFMTTYNIILFKSNNVKSQKEIDLLNKYYNSTVKEELQKYNIFKANKEISDDDYTDILKYVFNKTQENIDFDVIMSTNNLHIDDFYYVLVNTTITNIKKYISDYFKEKDIKNKWININRSQTSKKENKNENKEKTKKTVNNKNNKTKTEKSKKETVKKIIKNNIQTKDQEQEIKIDLDNITDDSDEE